MVLPISQKLSSSRPTLDHLRDQVQSLEGLLWPIRFPHIFHVRRNQVVTQGRSMLGTNLSRKLCTASTSVNAPGQGMKGQQFMSLFRIFSRRSRHSSVEEALYLSRHLWPQGPDTFITGLEAHPCSLSDHFPARRIGPMRSLSFSFSIFISTHIG